MLVTIAIFSIFLSILSYIIISSWGSRSTMTTERFYHDVGSTKKAIVSLTAFNLTLGTGLAYVLGQAAYVGPLIFLTPAGMLLGYILIAIFYKKVAYQANEDKPNIFYLMSPLTATDKTRLSTFVRAFSLCILMTYILLVSYELSAGSSIILNSLVEKPTPLFQACLALTVFLVIAVYTALGGLKAAVDTDILQLGLAVLFIVVLAIFLLPDAKDANVLLKANKEVRFDTALPYLTAILSVITAVTTQFYSIVNVNVGSNFSAKNQYKIYLWVGLWSSLIYTLIAFISLYFGSPSSFSLVIRGFLEQNNGNTYANYALCFLIFSGMLAVLMSTLDNATMSVSQIASDNLFGISSYGKSTESAKDVKKLRYLHFIMSFVIAILLVILINFFSNAFSLLLTILFVATIFSPIACTAVYLHSQKKASLIDFPRNALTISLIVFGCWVTYIYFTLRGMILAGTILHLISFLMSVLIAGLDVIRSKSFVESKP